MGAQGDWEGRQLSEEEGRKMGMVGDRVESIRKGGRVKDREGGVKKKQEADSGRRGGDGEWETERVEDREGER